MVIYRFLFTVTLSQHTKLSIYGQSVYISLVWNAKTILHSVQNQEVHFLIKINPIDINFIIIPLPLMNGLHYNKCK